MLEFQQTFKKRVQYAVHFVHYIEPGCPGFEPLIIHHTNPQPLANTEVADFSFLQMLPKMAVCPHFCPQVCGQDCFSGDTGGWLSRSISLLKAFFQKIHSPFTGLLTHMSIGIQRDAYI